VLESEIQVVAFSLQKRLGCRFSSSIYLFVRHTILVLILEAFENQANVHVTARMTLWPLKSKCMLPDQKAALKVTSSMENTTYLDVKFVSSYIKNLPLRNPCRSETRL
jgi:hypothetical protein